MISRLTVAAAACVVCLSAASAQDGAPIAGKWRITRAVIAPWSDEAGAGAAPEWIGKTVAFGAKSVRGPHPIACGKAIYESTEVPAEGLFQGGLPEPATEAMTTLGLSGASVKGVTVSCDTGVFDYHFADADTLLLALDNRIWTLDQTAGTRAAKSSPEGVVQRFLEAHFVGDMAFTKDLIASRSATITPDLFGKFRAYFAKPSDLDEAPAINGDPFTDSQDYPARFSVGAGDPTGVGMVVPVEFADAFASKAVLYELARKRGRWLISDLIYEDGSRLSAILSEP